MFSNIVFWFTVFWALLFWPIAFGIRIILLGWEFAWSDTGERIERTRECL